MAIFLRQSHLIKPLRWGSPADVQYAIRVNNEKIYGIDPDNDVLVMPLFWGLPPLDYSKYDNNGTNYGATYKDGSLDFDGVNDYMDVGSGNSLDISGDMSLFTWAKFDNIVDTQQIIIQSTAGVGDIGQYGLEVGRTNNEIAASWEDTIIDYSSSNLQTGQWYYIGWTRSGTTGNWTSKIYVDGILDETLGSIATNPGSQSLLNIGWLNYDTPYYYNGIIDEVRISNVARTADQIALFHDLPWDLYRPVSRPVWSIPAAGGVAPTANLYGSFYGPLAGVI